jgi:predicted AAA+ superfamily ATPase
MFKQTEIEEVITLQRQKLNRQSVGLERELLPKLPDLDTHALIISGIRRCGKSTMLTQILKQKKQPVLYLNFDDPRLYDFVLKDFQLLDKVIEEHKAAYLFFDEIQVVKGWELYIRQKLDEGFRLFVTGSNATMLSRELGTKLTGRHITKELFPFSYREFLQFKSLENNEKSFQKYMKTGGFPQFLKTNNTDILSELFTDILNRDIIVRYGVRDTAALKRLAVYLVSNAGNLVTAGKLQQPLSIKSSATIMEYFSFLEDTYLLSFMPKFSYSLKVQLVNPRKIYVVDTGLLQIVSNSFTEDKGHILENLVFNELRRKTKELYYFNEKGAECDFVVMKNEKLEQVIQVCYEMTPENSEREMTGLNNAMDFFKTDKGIILTLNQQDAYMHNGKRVEIVPVWQWQRE